MRFRVLALAGLLGLLACATTAKYERRLDTWIGANVSRLIEAWGPPYDTFAMPDGRTLYTWVSNAGAVAVPVGNLAYAVQRYCVTTFTVGADGSVQRWRWEGNACKSKE